MNTKTYAWLIAPAFLLGGVGTACADEFRSASTPERTPAIATPDVATPAIATPAVTTPDESVTLTVHAIQLPTGAEVGLAGVVDQSITTPASTPEQSVAPAVASQSVQSIAVDPVVVDAITVEIPLPAAATVGAEGSTASTTGLPVMVSASQQGDAVEIGLGLDR